MSRVRRALPAIAAIVVLSAGVALAAGLGVTSTRVTTFSADQAAPTTTAPPAATTCTLTASADATAIPSQSPNNGNTLVSLDANPTNANDQRPYVKFDFSQCTGLTATSSVSSAQLVLRTTTGTDSGNRTIAVHGVTSSWTETSLSYTGSAFATTATTSTTENPGIAGTMTWAVTSDFASGARPTNGWVLVAGSTNKTTVFHSREATTATDRPKLTLTFTP